MLENEAAKKHPDLFELSLSFWEHVSELRKMLLKSLFIIVIGMACSLYFHQEIFSWLTVPLKSSDLIPQKILKERVFNTGTKERIFEFPNEHYTLFNQSGGVYSIKPHTFIIPENGYLEYERIHVASEKMELMLLGPLDGMSIVLKMSFWMGLVATSPIWIFFILRYVAPALNASERLLLVPFLLLSLLFISTGLLLAFFVTIPLANQYLLAFNNAIGVNMWSLVHYFDYSLMLLLANALAFEGGVVLLFLVNYGLLTEKMLRTYRRHAIVSAFIIAAILTPPDILTQFMLAIPLIALYEITILYAKTRQYQEEVSKSKR